MNKLTFVLLSLFACNSFSAPSIQEINGILKLIPSITLEEISSIAELYQAADEANKGDKIAFKVFSKDGNVCAKTNETERCFSHDRIRELIVEMVKNSDRNHMETVVLPNLNSAMAALLANSEGASASLDVSKGDAKANITTPAFNYFLEAATHDNFKNVSSVAVDLKTTLKDVNNFHFGYRVEIDTEDNEPTSVNGFWKRTKSDVKA